VLFKIKQARPVFEPAWRVTSAGEASPNQQLLAGSVPWVDPADNQNLMDPGQARQIDGTVERVVQSHVRDSAALAAHLYRDGQSLELHHGDRSRGLDEDLLADRREGIGVIES
jgi:hypothetical protein